MKLRRWLFSSGALGVIVAMALGLAAQAPPASSPASGREKIAIISIQAAIRATGDGQQAAAQIRTEFAPRDNDLKVQQQSLQALQQQLKEGGNTLSIGAKDELEQRISNKQKQIQRAYEDAQSDLQSAESDAVNRIGQKMMKVVSDYATAHGYALVLDVSNPNTPVLYAARGINITDPIVALYNKDYPVAASSATTAQH
ncbi:MAG: OmpH family outer membrane protein [Terriglobales bacterium]